MFDLCSKASYLTLIHIQESFLNVSSWIKEVEKHSGEDVTIMVLANKADVEEEAEVSEADIKKFEEEYKLKVIKTSAKTGTNVDESFLEMTKKLIVKKNNSGQDEKKKAMGLKKLRDGLENGNSDGSRGVASCCST